MDDFDDTAPLVDLPVSREPEQAEPHEQASAPGARSAGPPDRGPRRLVAGSPEDLLACVPLALGFVPSRSVVMLAVGGGRGPHARVDLPDPARAEDVVRSLAGPALAHGVTRVALVVYADLERAREFAPALLAGFAGAGIEVAALVGADGAGWISMLPGRHTREPREYDVLAHRFVAEAVLRGQVVLGSREALLEAMRPVPAEVEEVGRCVEALAAGVVAVTPERLTRLLRRTVALGHPLGAEQVALLRHGVETAEGRDAAWSWVRREDARAHADLWIRVVRSCGVGEAAAPASVLAFHAWLTGDGALAWCALDRAGEQGRGTSLAALVGDLLERAVPPSAWEPLAPRTDPGAVRGSARSRARAVDRSGPAGAAEAVAGEVVDLAERRRRKS